MPPLVPPRQSQARSATFESIGVVQRKTAAVVVVAADLAVVVVAAKAITKKLRR
jgi:hypothetical protein